MSIDTKKEKSPSRERLVELSKEQQFLSSTFKIDNFYHDHKLNVNHLKTKLKEIKNKHNGKSKQSYHSIQHDNTLSKDFNERPKSRNETLIRPISRQIKIKSSRYEKNPFYEDEKRTDSGFSTSRVHNLNPESRLSTISKIHSIGGRQYMKELKKKPRHQINQLAPLAPKMIKKQLLSNIQVEQFQKNITFLWQIYQLLGEITKNLSLMKKWEKDESFIQLISEYKPKICSQRFEFLLDLLKQGLLPSYQKTIIHSRLLENLSIIYIFVQISEKRFNHNSHSMHHQVQSSHLVNFVGLCSNNLLLLIRLMMLTYYTSYDICPDVLEILQTIARFELQSYHEQLKQTKNVMIRMEHNNELISIIQVKLNQRLNKPFQQVIVKFLKNVERLKQPQPSENSSVQVLHTHYQPLYEYGYYIFEYLAYHLHHENYIGLFPTEIQTAPQPYLLLKHEFTVIINPLKVFLHQKKKIYVRAFTEKFLHELAERCNVVLWADGMPNEVDPLLDLLPKGEYKKLYGHHCTYVNIGKRMQLFKLIERIGCRRGKFIVFDGDKEHYPQDDSRRVVLLGWKGQSEDRKLLTLLDIILPFMREGGDLDKTINLLKPQLDQLTSHRRKPC